MCVACARVRARFENAKSLGKAGDAKTMYEWAGIERGSSKKASLAEREAAFYEAIDALPDEALPPVNGHLGRALTYAMIRQAVLDFQSGEPELADDAEGWITSRSGHPFSFDFCCSILRVDRDAVEGAILSGAVKSLPELSPKVIEGDEHLVECSAPDFVEHD